MATRLNELSSSLLTTSSRHTPPPPPKWLQLSCCYYIFFTQYAVALLISPFFPTSPAGRAIGPTMVGAVFAAYSFATALATPLPPLAMRHLGTRRTVALGLALSAVGSLAFGCLPLLVSSSTTSLAVGLLCCRIVGGLGASLSESACLAVVSTPGATAAARGDTGEGGGGGGDGDGDGDCDGDGSGDGETVALAGVEISSVEVFTGVGAAAGAALGGGLYQVGAETPFGAFLFPFVVAALLPLAAVPCVFVALPPPPPPPPDRTTGEADGEGKAAGVGGGGVLTPEAARRLRAASRDFAPAAIGITLTAAVCEANNPILAPRMRAAYGVDEGGVGLMFAALCVLYMLCAVPCGLLVDRVGGGAHGGRNLRRIMQCGWAVGALGHAMLGPLQQHAWLCGGGGGGGGGGVGGPAGDGWCGLLLSMAAMPVLGVGSAMMIMPSLPSMQRGLAPDDDEGRTAVCALWNGLYNVGQALGPLLSAATVGWLGFEATMRAIVALCVACMLALGLVSEAPARSAPSRTPG